MTYLRSLLAAALLMVGISPALCQIPNFTLPPSSVVGRSAAGAGPAQAIPFSQLLAAMGTQTSLTVNSVVFPGATSGSVNISAQAIAGTPTIKWPTTSGTVPTTATAPITLNSTTGAIGCATCVTSATVTSIAGNTGAFTLGAGLTNSVNDLRVSLSALTTSLGADVALNNTANYFDGPSVAQGTSGTWWAAGTVTIKDTAGIAQIMCKLWDGTTVIASGDGTVPSASTYVVISLHGYLASPAGNIRISCKDITSTSGAFVFNQTGNSKDGTVSVHRIQ